MSRRAPAPVQTPFDQTSEVINTPDIDAYRGYQPNTDILQAAVNAQFRRAQRQNEDQFGAYSGISSQVARNRLQSMAADDLNSSRGLALAEGNTQAQRLKMAQLESLANLTAKRHDYGYNSQIPSQQPGLLGSIVGGAASAGTAALIA
jgi:hypothetical protein